MERLTERKELAGRNAAFVPGNSCFYSSRYRMFAGNAIELLAAIEDILGDTYGLDRLRELVEADRDERCVVLSDDGDYIPRQAVIDLLYYYADEACSAIVADVERIPGVFVGVDDSWLMK